MDKNFQKLEESDQATVLAALATIGPQIFTDRSEFQKQLLQHLKKQWIETQSACVQVNPERTLRARLYRSSVQEKQRRNRARWNPS